jgi:muconolactone delta-isomerase
MSEKIINRAPYRLEGESYEDYKVRRKAIKEATKRYLKGKMVWPSKGEYYSLGTYRKDSGIDLNKRYLGDDSDADDTPDD